MKFLLDFFLKPPQFFLNVPINISKSFFRMVKVHFPSLLISKRRNHFMIETFVFMSFLEAVCSLRVLFTCVFLTIHQIIMSYIAWVYDSKLVETISIINFNKTDARFAFILVFKQYFLYLLVLIIDLLTWLNIQGLLNLRGRFWSVSVCFINLL
jgi:hypothetical protein